MLARIKIPGSFERILYIQGGWEVSCLFSAFYVLCSKVACSCPDSWGGGGGGVICCSWLVRFGASLAFTGCLWDPFIESLQSCVKNNYLIVVLLFFFFSFHFFWSGALKQQRKRVRIAASLKTGLRSENLSTDKACAGKGVSNSTA